MYCPKCGDGLERRPTGELTCERGDMRLSKELERRLTECFVDRTRRPGAVPLHRRVGGSWYCPGCGVAMVETDPGLITCPRCGLALGELVHELIELHPHRAIAG